MLGKSRRRAKLQRGDAVLGGNLDSFVHGSGEHIGPYEILQPLSAGGMGEVYLARKVVEGVFEKLVAIKTIRADGLAADGRREAFLDEAQLVARLSHPGIAQVHDLGVHDGSPFVVMEFVDGVPLSSIIAAHGGLPPNEAVAIIAQAAHALDCAHDARSTGGEPLAIVHRDVSPQNIMVTREGHAKLIDFGIALSRERLGPHTRTGMVKGKPAYMAPEQLRHEEVDRRADLFSLGAVLHECLTGKPVFAKETLPS
ncbi:MAG: serine/threonine-protein kinase, partial [Myxococcota bacterium]